MFFMHIYIYKFNPAKFLCWFYQFFLKEFSMCGCSECMCVWDTCLTAAYGGHNRVQRAFVAETWVIEGYELPYGFWESNFGPLGKQLMLSTTEPFLHPPNVPYSFSSSLSSPPPLPPPPHCRPEWPQIYHNSPSLASWVMGELVLQVGPTIPDSPF